jgi:mannan endo-1,4-beta-mannosidase
MGIPDIRFRSATAGVSIGLCAVVSAVLVGCGGSSAVSQTASSGTSAVQAVAPAPTLELSASPGSISSGASSMLSWSATNATSCTASGGWSGSMAMSGSKSTGALSSTTTYTLSCSGASGTTPASMSTTVSVQSQSTGGGVARPSYNTGYGLFVLNGKLYDSKGIEFKIRGVNLCHYDSTGKSGPGIARSNANAVRVALWLSSVPTSTYVSTLQTYISDSEVVIPTMFEVPGGSTKLSGDNSTADLDSAVNNWVSNISSYAPIQQHLIIDIANEWGPPGYQTTTGSATWASAYESAIAKLRAAGYTAPIMVDTGNSGEDFGDLLNYATQVFNSDPQKNVIFSLHLYYNSASALSGNVLPQLAALAASQGMVFVVGEFGPGRDIGPAPTMVTPQQIIQAADSAGLGWLAWAWDDNDLSGGASDNNWFSMTYAGPGIYNVASDLTTYGQQIVLSNYALTLAKKATDF